MSVKTYPYTLCILLVHFFFYVGFAQISVSNLDTCIKQLKEYQLANIESTIDSMPDSVLKDLLLADINYKKKGLKVVSDSFNISKLKGRESYVAQFLKAEFIEREEKGKDSLVFNMYLSSFKKAKKEKDTLIINEVLKRLNYHLYTNSNELKTFKKYIDISNSYKQDSIDKFYVQYYTIAYEFLSIDFLSKKMDTLWFKDAFKKGYDLITVPYLKALLDQTYSIYYGSYLENFEKGLFYNKKAIENYKKDSLYISKKGIRSILFNMGVDHFNQGNYESVIPIFKKDLEYQTNRLYRMYGYDWLYKSYEVLNKADSALYYFKKMTETKDKLDRLKHARVIKRVESEYDFSKKEEDLKNLAKKYKAKTLQLNTIFPILGIISALLIISIYLYKRYKGKTKILEGEKSQTLQKLDELKSIVTKNHIILKDKSKVYVSDLMYIKSDDHYLEVVTQNNKKYTVRGQLSKIKEELPPNFIQCHRSFIINSNFIKQVNSNTIVLINKEHIPLSRSYKNRF